MTTSQTGKPATVPDGPGTKRLKHHGPRRWVHPLAEQLRARRYQLGISQEDLAAQVGLSQSQVSDMERGAVSPTLATLNLIAKALKVKLVAVPDDDD